MSIFDKILKIGGRDSNGETIPIKTDIEGNVSVVIKGGSSGGSGFSGSLTAKDITSGEQKEITAIEDDAGEHVLRTVDAAPFIVEISRFSDAFHSKVDINHLISNTILPTNPERKFALIQNTSPDEVLLSLGSTATLERGLLIKPNSEYEMSAMKGNLYTGEINAIVNSNGADLNLFDPTLIKQGGLVNGDINTSSMTRTYVHPISVDTGKQYKLTVDSESIRIRSIYGYYGEAIRPSITILFDTVVTDRVFNVPEGVEYIAVSFCKVATEENLTPEETKTATIKLIKPTVNTLFVTEGV